MKDQRRFEKDLADEMESHLQMHIDDNLRAGMTPEEARRHALLKLGGVEQVKEACRERRGTAWIEGWLQDFRFGLRMLRKAPGFTCIAILCLGLGIGVNASIFSVLNFAFLRPLPVRDPLRLVVYSRGTTPLASYSDYEAYRDRSRTLQGVASSIATESSLDFDGLAHAAGAEAVSANYPQVIGVGTYLGRWFTNETDHEAVISYRTWQYAFHGDPNVLGKRIRSEAQWYTVVGIAPRDFEGTYVPIAIDLWVPFHIWADWHTQPRVFIFGRLKDGATAKQASAEFNSIAKERETTEKVRQPIVMDVVRGSPNAVTRRTAAPAVAMLMIVVGVVLLIACLNVGNLLLARAAARSREISMRIALGAGRGRLLRQLLTEGLLLAIGGGAAGVVLGAWTSRLLELLLNLSPYEGVQLNLPQDSRVLAFTASLSLLTVLFFGLAPAWRYSKSDVPMVLKGTAGVAGTGLRSVTVVAQVALSLMLLITSGLFLRMLGQFGKTNPGFAVKNRMYASTLVSPPEFTPETTREFYAQTLERLRALPGVASVAMVNILPLTPIGAGCASRPGGEQVASTSSRISPGYLETMRIPLIAGRDFPAINSVAPGANTAIVSEALAARLWPHESALGKRVSVGCRDPQTAEVIGVAADSKVVSLGETARPHVYRPFAQSPEGWQNIMIETSGESGVLAETIRKTIVESNAAVRIYGVKSFGDWVGRSYWMSEWIASVLGVFATLAMVLAAVGLYGVLAYRVALRTREIGVRMALGARAGDVFGMVLRQSVTLTVVGIAIGLLLSLGMSRALASVLSGVSATDALTYVSVALLWLAVAALAGYLPARHAARVDPMVALRHE